MALKKVTELLLLWSIETIRSVFDYLLQQASSELAVSVILFSTLRRDRQAENMSIIARYSLYGSPRCVLRFAVVDKTQHRNFL